MDTWKKLRMALGVLGLAVALLVLPGLAGAAENGGTGAKTRIYDGTGRIDAIRPWKIIIDDTAYKYEAGTKFYSEDNKVIGSGAFAPGMDVGYVFSPQEKRVIVKIWKLKPRK